MAPLLFGLAMVGFTGWAIVAAQRQRAQRRDTLGWLARELHGIAIHNEVTATVGGAAVRFCYETRGAGSTSEQWTEVDVDIPPAYPFALHVRRHEAGDHARIDRGEMVDVVVGHRGFDDEFLVEGAPADVVKRFFDDAPLRRMLSAHPKVELGTHRVGDRAFVRFGMRGWVHDAAEARALIEAVARIPDRVRAAFSAADRAIPTGSSGAPYRPLPNDQPARDVAAARVYEVARLEAMRARRRPSGNDAIVVVLFILLAYGLILAISAAR